jgi:hypothetical protein
VPKAVSNLVQAFAAVVVGNAAYFLLMPHLPAGAYHIPFRLDAGLAVDFALCAAVFGLIKAIAR